MQELTKKQRETLTIVSWFRQLSGTYPTQAELSRILMISPNAVRCRLIGLWKKDLLEWHEGKSRAFRLKGVDTTRGVV